MINVNLAPLEELESPYWFLPDLFVVVAATAAIWYFGSLYRADLVKTIATTESEIRAKTAAFDVLTRETDRYVDLDKGIERLNDQLAALKKITVSPIKKFRSVILIEHLQNLKPDGIWFNYVSENSDQQTVTVVGKAVDSILFAEFISALNATRSQVLDPSDLRSQVYFDAVQLEMVSLSSSAGSVAPKSTFAGVLPGSAQVASLVTDPRAASHWRNTDRVFPGIGEYPSFQLTVSYKERKPTEGKRVAFSARRRRGG